MTALLTFLATLSVLVLVHEWGHFAAARRAGVTVHEFGFGFPPRLFGIRRGATVYSVNLVPFGGFVKLEGEGDDRTGPGSFKAKGAGTRAWILASGVLMNLLASVVLFSITLSVGVPTELDPDQVPTSARAVRLVVAEVQDGTPAASAGLTPGDSISAIDGTLVTDVNGLRAALAAAPASAHTLTLRHGRTVRTLSIVPAPGPDGTPRLGIGGVTVGTVGTPFPRSVVAAVGLTAKLVATVGVALGTVVRDLTLHGAVPGDITGPIGIAVLSGRVAEAGFIPVLQFIGVLSVSLAVINALPIPALDGGRLLFIAIEAVRRRPVNPRVERAFHAAGFYALLLLVVLVSIKDFRQFRIIDALRNLVS